MNEFQIHAINAVHPVPDQPFAFRTYPRDAVMAAFDPDGRLTVDVSVPVDGQLAVRQHAHRTFGWEGFDAALVADTLGPIRRCDPTNDVLDHRAVVMLDDGVLRVFRARLDSDTTGTGQYQVIEVRVPGRQTDVAAVTLTDQQTKRLVLWLAGCIEVAAARREGFMLWRPGRGGRPNETLVAVAGDCLEVSRMGSDLDNPYDPQPALARIPVRSGASNAAAEVLLDDIVSNGLTPFDVSPMFARGWGDRAVAL
jgi:hypothetical protein